MLALSLRHNSIAMKSKGHEGPINLVGVGILSKRIAVNCLTQPHCIINCRRVKRSMSEMAKACGRLFDMTHGREYQRSIVLKTHFTVLTKSDVEEVIIRMTADA